MFALLSRVGWRHKPVMRAAPRRCVVDLGLRVDGFEAGWEVPGHDGDRVAFGLDPQSGA